jgi:RND family efflux transporter MFP subunit
MKQYIFMGLVGLFLLGSCNSKSGRVHEEESVHSHEGHDHEQEGHSHEQEGHSHEHGSEEITLSPEKAQAAGVRSEVIEPTAFRNVIRTGGRIVAAQGDESTVVAGMSGVVSFRNKPTEGAAIGKGATLLTLSSRHMAEGDRAEKARIAYEVSRKEYERMKPLVESQIVSEKEFATVRQTYENARIAYEAIAKNSTAQGVGVTAPIGGYIKRLLVGEGDYVEAGTPLAVISQNRLLYLRAEVSEKYYGALAGIASANFRTPYNNKVYRLDELDGRLLSYGKSTGTESYYIPVTFEFANRGDFVPGSFVEVFLLSAPMPQVLAVPHTALTEEQGSFYVYVQTDEEGYRKQLVSTGVDNGERVQILSGLHAGDRVVTQGAYQVKLASATSAIPAHTHEH